MRFNLNKYKFSLSIGVTAILLSACSVEAPFKAEKAEGTGRLITSTMSVQVKGSDPISRATVDGIPSPSDFQVDFFKGDDKENSVITYERYGNMPEVVELTAGTYTIGVSYGGTYGDEFASAAFNAPFYQGESESFDVEVDKIVSDLQPIVCRLKNVRVRINFDVSLSSAMGPESKVTVQLGNGTPLEFNKQTTQDGYFDLTSTSMTAVFTGSVEGYEVTEEKTISNVAAGNYYIITFSLHSADASSPGNIIPDGDGEGNNEGFVIESKVNVKDLNDDSSYDSALNPENPDDRYVEDDQRPENGEAPGTDTPGTDNPGTETPGDPSQGGEEQKGNPPTMTSVGVDLNKVNVITEDSTCILYIVTESQLSKFTVKIKSDSADFTDSLSDFNLDGELDLLNADKNDGGFGGALSGFGFPVGEDLKNPSDKDDNGNSKIKFEISGMLMNMLQGFEGTHEFTLTVGNAGGNLVKTLKLKVVQ